MAPLFPWGVGDPPRAGLSKVEVCEDFVYDWCMQEVIKG